MVHVRRARRRCAGACLAGLRLGWGLNLRVGTPYRCCRSDCSWKYVLRYQVGGEAPSLTMVEARKSWYTEAVVHRPYGKKKAVPGTEPERLLNCYASPALLASG